MNPFQKDSSANPDEEPADYGQEDDDGWGDDGDDGEQQYGWGDDE